MSEEEEHKWIWDVWGSKAEIFVEFLKGPEKWDDTFRHWVLRRIADRLLDSWLEVNGDEELLREGAEFMEDNVMGEAGDPDADQMVGMFQNLNEKSEGKA